MAPITETTVSDLEDLVHKLEARVHHLESRYESGGQKAQSATEAMRMILIGPPGSGASRKPESRVWPQAHILYRKGNTSSEDQREVLRLPSGMLAPLPSHTSFPLTFLRLPETCCEPKSQRRPRLEKKLRRSWTRADLSVTTS
jgi:hypothetical protein